MLKFMTGLVGGWYVYALAGAVVFGLGFGAAWKVQSWRAAEARAVQAAALIEQATRALQTQRDQDAVTAKAGLDAAVLAAQARVVTETIIKKVPVYVTKTADSRCVVPTGFVRLHDAAAAGTDLSTVPGPAGKPDDAAAGIALSAVAGTVAANYGTCTEVSGQLRALQGWVAGQRALAKPRGSD